MRSSNIYENLMAFDIDDSNHSKILTQKETLEEDYSKLERYLEEVVIPSNIQYKKVLDEYKPYIKYSIILKYGFSLEELRYTINYLKNKDIEIISFLNNSYFSKDFKLVYNKYSYKLPFGELKELKKCNAEEQNKLLLEYKETHDINIKQKLINSNIPLVLNVMSKLTNLKTRDDFYDDILSEGILGLIHAIEDYNPSTNYQFSTLAVKYIINSILNYLRKNNAISPLYDNFLTAKSVIEERFRTTLEHDFTIFDYILDYMVENNQIRDVDRVLVTRRLVWFLKKIYPIYKTDSEYIDYQELDSNLISKEIKEILRDGLNNLDYDTKEAICLRYGLNTSMLNLSDISLIYNMSISGIRKKIKRGLENLKQYYDYNTGEKRISK